jgi:predicted MPP superfamily phosphohydrolase
MVRSKTTVALFATLLASLTIARAAGQVAAPKVALPNKDGTVKFAVIGDSGTGGSAQMQIAEQLAATRSQFPFTFAVMLGDNMYGSERPVDFVAKFERPYKPLLDAGVKFYAALGNHDDPNERFYKLFNMNGERYYSFKAPQGSVRFFALDSNYMDKPQLEWVEKELAASDSQWKIAFFHHPLYSSGEKHGSDEVLREQLEPLFLKYGVNLVLTGHEHFYERIKPQKGITYIVAGSSAKLRKGNIGQSDITAKGFDQGYAFLLMEIDGDVLQFQTINEAGKTVDAGSIQREDKKTTANGVPRQPK